MFYTETIRVPAQKPSLMSRFMRAIERLGYLRAEAELKRLGYTQEALRVRKQINSL